MSEAQRARREAILQAAAAEFSEYGFERAKVKRIAERAGVAAGTCYLYFTGKEDLLLATIGRLSELLISGILRERRQAQETLDKLAASIVGAVVTMSAHRTLAHAVLLAGVGHPSFEAALQTVHNELARFVEADLREAQQEGLLPPLDTRIASRAWVGTFYEVIVAWLRHGEPARLEEALPTLLEFNLRGIGAPPDVVMRHRALLT